MPSFPLLGAFGGVAESAVGVPRAFDAAGGQTPLPQSSLSKMGGVSILKPSKLSPLNNLVDPPTPRLRRLGTCLAVPAGAPSQVGPLTHCVAGALGKAKPAFPATLPVWSVF